MSSDDRVGKTTRITGMVCSASSFLAHLWHPRRTGERQLPRIPSDALPSSMMALGQSSAFVECRNSGRSAPKVAICPGWIDSAGIGSKPASIPNDKLSDRGLLGAKEEVKH